MNDFVIEIFHFQIHIDIDCLSNIVVVYLTDQLLNDEKILTIWNL